MARIGPKPNKSISTCAADRPVSGVVPAAPPPAMSMVDMPVCVLAVADLEKSIKFFGKAVAVEQLLAELNDG